MPSSSSSESETDSESEEESEVEEEEEEKEEGKGKEVDDDFDSKRDFENLKKQMEDEHGKSFEVLKKEFCEKKLKKITHRNSQHENPNQEKQEVIVKMVDSPTKRSGEDIEREVVRRKLN